MDCLFTGGYNLMAPSNIKIVYQYCSSSASTSAITLSISVQWDYGILTGASYDWNSNNYGLFFPVYFGYNEESTNNVGASLITSKSTSGIDVAQILTINDYTQITISSSWRVSFILISYTSSL